MNLLLPALLLACAAPAAASNELTKLAFSGDTTEVHTMSVRKPDEFKSQINAQDDAGDTPLIAALRGKSKNSKWMVWTLINAGADPSIASKGGRTPLAGAASMGDLKIVEELLDNGAKAAQLTDGESALHAVVDGGDHSIIGDNFGTSRDAIVRLLVKKGADLSVPGYLGLTPLHYAARNGSFAVAKARVLLGAPIDARDDGEATPLYLAAEKGNGKIVTLLLDKGADPTLRARNISPAMVAESSGHASLARTLAEAETRFIPRGPGQAVVRRTASDIDKPSRRFPENAADFALVVGVEKYANGLPDAQYAERDAEAVRAHLVALGVPERNIKFLSGSRASLSAMTALVEDWLTASVGENGRAFFYFSGHGSPDPATGQVFLVPHDGMPSLLTKTAYPVKRLYESLEHLKAKQVIVALDACFSGMGGRSVLPEGARPLILKGGTSLNAGSRILLLAASGPKQITGGLPEQGHGIFTYHLLKGLGGAAVDSDGVITPLGLYDYMKPKIQDDAARQNREQTPVLEGAVTGELVPALPKH